MRPCPSRTPLSKSCEHRFRYQRALCRPDIRTSRVWSHRAQMHRSRQYCNFRIHPNRTGTPPFRKGRIPANQVTEAIGYIAGIEPTGGTRRRSCRCLSRPQRLVHPWHRIGRKNPSSCQRRQRLAGAWSICRNPHWNAARVQ